MPTIDDGLPASRNISISHPNGHFDDDDVDKKGTAVHLKQSTQLRKGTSQSVLGRKKRKGRKTELPIRRYKTAMVGGQFLGGKVKHKKKRWSWKSRKGTSKKLKQPMIPGHLASKRELVTEGLDNAVERMLLILWPVMADLLLCH